MPKNKFTVKGKGAVIDDANIGEGTVIWHYANLYKCTIGKNCIIGSYVEIGGAKIGDNCKIQSFVSIPPKVEIGNNVFIGPGVRFGNCKYPNAKGGFHFKPVIVEDNVVIGVGSVIVPGVTIGKGSFIKAGSVVKKSVPANTIVGDNPEIPYKVSDVHVHVGENRKVHVPVGERDIMLYASKNYVKHLVIFPLDVKYPMYNDLVLKIVSSDNPHIFGLLRVQMETPKSYLDTLKDCPKNILGFKFHPTFDRMPVTNQKLAVFFKWLEDNGKIAMIHCGRWKEVAGSEFAIEIAKQYPNLTVVLAHMGGSEYDLAMETIKMAENIENVYLDTSNCRVPLILDEVQRTNIGHRVLFGSDYPLGSPLANIYLIIGSNLSRSVKKAILHENFDKLLAKMGV